MSVRVVLAVAGPTRRPTGLRIVGDLAPAGNEAGRVLARFVPDPGQPAVLPLLEPYPTVGLWRVDDGTLLWSWSPGAVVLGLGDTWTVTAADVALTLAGAA